MNDEREKVEPEGLTPKEAWWAGARAGLGLPANTPRNEVASRLSAEAGRVAAESPGGDFNRSLVAEMLRDYADGIHKKWMVSSLREQADLIEAGEGEAVTACVPAPGALALSDGENAALERLEAYYAGSGGDAAKVCALARRLMATAFSDADKLTLDRACRLLDGIALYSPSENNKQAASDAKGDIRALARRLAVPVVAGWQPIESAPRDRLCFVWCEGWIDADACWWDTDRKLWREHRGDAVVSPQPTHFYQIPLPTPPKDPDNGR